MGAMKRFLIFALPLIAVLLLIVRGMSSGLIPTPAFLLPQPAGETPVAGGSAAGCLSRAYSDAIGGPISFTDMTGKAVTEADYKGDYSLVFFGFTYCPDVCPMTLVNIDRALAKLPADVTPPRVLLISVDPARDTPEQLAKYLSVDAFPDTAIGLSGTEEQLQAASDVFIAPYQRIEQPDSAAGYTMDHTALIYLMDEDWKLATFFDGSETPGAIAGCLAQVIGGSGG